MRPQALAQAKTEIALSRQPGIFYMPSYIMEKQKLNLIFRTIERNTVQKWGTQS